MTKIRHKFHYCLILGVKLTDFNAFLHKTGKIEIALPYYRRRRRQFRW